MYSSTGLIVLGALFSLVLSQESPCPDFFQYRNGNGQTYGVIQLKPGYLDKIVTSVGFSIAAHLPTTYVGKLSIMDSHLSSSSNDGLHVSGVRYRVDFPITLPLPQLTFLKVNDELLCKENKDLSLSTAKAGEFKTTITLQHVLILSNGAEEFLKPSPGPADIFRPTNALPLPKVCILNLIRNRGQIRTHIMHSHGMKTGATDEDSHLGQYEIIRKTRHTRYKTRCDTQFPDTGQFDTYYNGKMNNLRSLSVVYALLFCQVSSQDSPCPDTFQYRNDGGEFYGYIQLQPYGRVETVVISVNFTIATQLQSSYVGKITPIDDINYLNLNRGAPIRYRVHFPVTSPLPRLTAIIVNNNVLCYGPGDIIQPGSYVTTISLEHKIFFNGGGNGGGFHSAQPSQPIWPNDIKDETQFFNFGNEDDYSLSNIRPNNVQVQPDPPVIYRPNPPPPKPGLRPNPPKKPVVRPPVYEQPSPIPTPKPRPTIQRPPPDTSSSSYAECGVSSNDDTLPLIVNGDEYDRGDWPWLTAVYKRKDGSVNFVCSGTLVSERHVITAAHCMYKKNSLTSYKDVVVKVGVFNLEDWGEEYTETRKLTAAAIHEKYNSHTLANDILVMTFERVVSFNAYVRPLCLWRGNTDLDRIVGYNGVVAGWGTSEDGPGGKGLPKFVKMPIVSTSTCRASKPDFHKLTSSNTLCAGSKNGAGPCLGDSGGGLYVLENRRWQLRGVVSLSLRPDNGDSTCNLNEYIVFTDAAQYLPWIRRVMAE